MQVTAIHTYPVKGCRRLDHHEATVEPWGLAGDRRWLVTDPAGGAITQRAVPKLALLRAEPGEDGLTLSYPGARPHLVPPLGSDAVATARIWDSVVAATPAGSAASAWLSGVLGRQVNLVWLADPTQRAVDPRWSEPGDRVSFADASPVLLTNSASLARLNAWMGEPLPMTRFRPNIVIDAEVPFIEDEWTGKTIYIGQTAFRVGKPCARCVVATTDQETGEVGQEPLRTLAKHRKVNQELRFGAYLIPVARGTIRLGDEVR